MTNEKYDLEVEIRQNSTDVTSDDPDITDVNVLTNTFEDINLQRTDSVRIYLDDDHDEALDVEVRHTHVDDDDFSGVQKSTTVSLTSGSDQGTATLDGPVGKIQIAILASGAAAAPTQGSMKVQALAHG